MLPVRPNEELPIVRILEDHTDTNTYYVRAVVQNARTLATLATLDLTDNGNRFFSYNWRTPADPTAAGIYIVITTTVYTDSGYTTKSENYGEKAETYKIEINKQSLGGGGGPDIDYKRVRTIVAEELEKLPKDEYPVPEKVNLTPLQAAVADLKRAIAAINIPQPEKTDFAPLIAKIEGVGKDVKGIDIPEIDLSSLESRLDNLEKLTTQAKVENVQKEVNQLFTRIKDFLDRDIESLKTELKKLNDKFEELPYVVIERKKQDSLNESL